MRPTRASSLSSFALLLCAAPLARAAIIHVPADAPTIAAALALAQDGDTVELAPGTYTGEGNRDLSIRTVAVTVRGAAGAAATIVDCEGDASSPRRAFDVTASGFHLAGVTIRNGYAVGNGAGVRISPEGTSGEFGGFAYSMTDCAFESCVVIAGKWPDDNGAAASISASDWAGIATLAIDRCTFTGNSGGGLHCHGVGSLAIRGTRFFANTDALFGSLEVEECSDILLDRCEFGFNHGVYAGALSVHGAFPIVSNCLVHNNIATEGYPAGSIGSDVCSCLEVSHSTFVGNRMADNRLDFVPLILPAGYVRNSILWEDGYIHLGHTLPLGCSLKQGGWEAYGNTDADPMFVDSENHDYRLRQESPLIDYCLAQATNCDSLDLDGNSRLVDVAGVGCGPMSAGDLGCFELQSTSKSGGDCDGDGIDDTCQILSNPGIDCDGNGVIDLCQDLSDPELDCDDNEVIDTCQILSNPALDCDGDGVLDACAIASGLVEDCDNNGVPDACQGTPFASSPSCLLLPGGGSGAVIPGFCNVMPTSEITIELWQWIKAPGPATTLRTHLEDSNRCLLHAPFTDGKIYWDFGFAVIPNGRLSYTPPEPIVGSWQHFALQASNAGDFMRIYRNGVLEAEKAGAETFTLNANSLRVGGTAWGSFDGKIDELRIWDHIRTAEEVQRFMGETVAPTTPGLVAYWRFDEGSGTLSEDLAGTYDALLSGPVQWIAALSCPPSPDLDGDGLVNGADLGLLLSAWGPAPSGSTVDLNSDGVVDGADLGALLSSWS